MVMKLKIGLASLSFLITLATHAQVFEKFRLGVGGGLAIPTGPASGPGILMYLEPSYPISNALRVVSGQNGRSSPSDCPMENATGPPFSEPIPPT